MTLEDQYRQLVASPVDWKRETSLSNIGDYTILVANWEKTLRNHVARAQDVACDSELQVLVLGTSELDRIVQNLKSVRSDAEQMYKKNGAGRLEGLTFMKPSEQKKHLAHGQSEVEALTRHGKPSLFVRNFTADEIKTAFWEWFLAFFDCVFSVGDYDELLNSNSQLSEFNRAQAKLWRCFLEESRVRVCANENSAIGASNGKTTSFVCFDVNIDSKCVHCFPVTQAEAAQIMDYGPILNMATLQP